MVFGGTDHSPSGSYRFGALYKAFMLNHAKLDAGRFEIRNCSVSEGALRNQFFIVARGAKKPECDTTLPVIEKTTLFGIAAEAHPDSCCNTLGGSDSILEEFSNVLARLLEKNPGSKVSLIGYAGTNVHNDNEKPRKTRWIAKKRRGWDNPAVVTRKLRKAEKYMLAHNIGASRISTINAGYKNTTSNVEFWFIPAGDKAPKPNPDYRVGKRSKTKR